MIAALAERLYSRLLEARARRYATGRADRVRLSRPTISVGNVTVGGTGKTPVVEHLASELSARGFRPAVLSRGYRRRSREPLLVCTGDGPRVGPEDGGDEPVAIATRLPRVVVAVARRRADAARLAETAGADVFVLDDGFQHLAVDRDLDLVLIDSADPFGGGRYPPFGRLREPLSALARADALVVTRADADVPPELVRALAARNPSAPVFAARIVASGFSDERGRRAEPPGGGFVAVCGIARPERFATDLERLGLAPRASLAYPDHRRYGARDRRAIAQAVARTGSSWIATTEKDAVKLSGALPVPLFALRLDVELEDPGFWTLVEARIGRGAGRETAPARR